MSDLFNSVKVGDTVHYSTPQGQYGKGKVVIHGGEHVVINRGKGQPQVVNDKNYVKHERGGKVIGALLSKLAQYDKNAKRLKEGAEKNPREAEWDQERKEGRAAATRHLNYQQSVLKSQDDLSFAKQKKRLAQKAALKKEDRRVEGPYGGHPYDWDPVLRQQIFAAVRKKVGKPTGPADNGRVYKPSKSGPPPRRGTTSESAILGAVAIGTGLGTVGSALAIKAGHYLANRSVDRDNKKAEAEAKKRTLKSAVNRLNKGQLYVRNEDASEAEGRGARIAKTKNKKKKIHEVSSALKKRYVAAASKDIDNSESEAKKHGNSEYGNKMYAKAKKRYDGITKAIKKVTEADESKYKKAAEKAIKLSRKNVKGNKHVDTEPTLNIPDKGTGGPIEGSEQGERNDRLS